MEAWSASQREEMRQALKAGTEQKPDIAEEVELFCQLAQEPESSSKEA